MIGDPFSRTSTNYLTRTHRKLLSFALCGVVAALVIWTFSTPDQWRDTWESASRWSSDTLVRPFQKEDPLWAERAARVKDAFQGAYGVYRKYAFGHDEVKPLSHEWKNNFNGWGVSIVDAMDTMLLMDLKEEFAEAREHVANIDWTKSQDDYVPFFEAVIRYLGGLISLYGLTKDSLFLSKADDLGRVLLPIFDSPSGLPAFQVSTSTGEMEYTPWNGGLTLLAEMATCQLEYKALAHYTGRREYFNTTDHIIDIMTKNQLNEGLWPTFWNPEDGTMANDHVSVGAMSDSAYEYLLKGYLLTGRTEKRLARMYIQSIRAIISNNFYLSRTRNLLYVSDTYGGRPTGRLEHLSCFLPGLITLGVHLMPDSVYERPREKELFTWAAKGLAHTCYVMYADQVSGVSPDEVNFFPMVEDDYESGRWMRHVSEWMAKGHGDLSALPGVGKLAEPLRGRNDPDRDYEMLNSAYILRPETTESMYLMWVTTKDPIWREHGWEMFEALQKHATTASGAWASLRGVDKFPVEHDDDMPSYSLAETFKYFYLLCLDNQPWPLDRFVFNTEAHPMPVFKWSEQEKKSFNINTS